MGIFTNMLHSFDSLIEMEEQMVVMGQHPDFRQGL